MTPREVKCGVKIGALADFLPYAASTIDEAEVKKLDRIEAKFVLPDGGLGITRETCHIFLDTVLYN